MLRITSGQVTMLSAQSQFAARVALPFDQAPRFPDKCLGCDETQPQLKWSPTRGHSPFTGKAQYFDNHDMLPHIEIPVCAECMDDMPGRTHEFSGVLASYFAPLLCVAATIFFYSVQLHAVAVLTGAAALVWILFATHAVWVVSHSTLFDLKVGKHESLIYYFRDEAYGKEFAELNQ
jgi:hypothetical protein